MKPVTSPEGLPQHRPEPFPGRAPRQHPNGLRALPRVTGSLIALTELPPGAPGLAPSLHLHIRLTAPDDQLLWRAYLLHKDRAEQLVRARLEALAKGRFEISSINFQHGSVDIVAILRFIVGLVGAYPGIKELIRDLQEALPEVIDSICEFFDQIMTDVQGSFVTADGPAVDSDAAGTAVAVATAATVSVLFPPLAPLAIGAALWKLLTRRK